MEFMTGVNKKDTVEISEILAATRAAATRSPARTA